MKGMTRKDVDAMMADDMLGTEERRYQPLYDTVEARDELLVVVLKMQEMLSKKKRLTPAEAVITDRIEQVLAKVVTP